MKLTDSKIVIISGKGGVGKSTLSLALAAAESEKGKRVLLVELGSAGFYSGLSGHETAFQGRAIFPRWPNLEVARWTGPESLEEYVLSILKIRPVVNAFFGHPVMKALIEAAPALPDVAILGKLTSGCRDVGPSLDYDLVIMDCYSTGHFLAMLRAPLGLADAIRVGPMGTQSREIHEVLCDPKLCQYGVVSLGEEMSFQEAGELADQLTEGWQAKPTLLLNQFTPEVEAADGATEFSHYLQSRYAIQGEILSNISQKGWDHLVMPRIFETDPIVRIEKIVGFLREVE